jgi:hypothetical protein
MQHNRELVKRICQRVPTSRIINLVFFWKLGSFGTILLLTSSPQPPGGLWPDLERLRRRIKKLTEKFHSSFEQAFPPALDSS